MNLDRYAPRLLGAAFLIVILTSMIGGTSLTSAVGSKDVSDILANIPARLSQVQFSILAQLLTSSLIVVLAVLLYTVLKTQSRILALVALGWWLAEAISLAVSQMGVIALIPLSGDFVAAGAPHQSFYQALGEFLYYGLYTRAYTMHMWFYCIGGLVWYSLFFASRYIPRAISLFGVLAVALGFIGIVAEFSGYDVPMSVYMPIGLFELIIGLWLLLKGIRSGVETGKRAATVRLST
ncbi:MAG: DUF4386 domain-containing protein [Anaerolineae bacterium]